ncbi:MAG TPA: glycosyltransferase family 39 protein [Opitutaceae bacterium]|nr:glycosyltransferase family 39 protein [Opitutaceae bacterium]
MSLNLAVRWLTSSGLFWLTVDLVLVGMTAWRVGRWRGAEKGISVLHALELGVIGIAWAVLSALVLGVGGWFDGTRLLELHAAVAVGVWTGWFVSRRAGDSRMRVVAEEAKRNGDREEHGPMAKWIVIVGACLLGLVVLHALVLAAGTFAANWDSQSYRLPRVGYWLQERRLSFHFANDSRLVYMPCDSELLMAWVTSFFPWGYPLVNLPQFFGGCLMLLATIELGRMAGLSRTGRLLAALLVVGMPNVYLEMSTSQSDLITGGLLNAGLVFVWRSLQSWRRRDVLLAGIAVGLAIGTKGTVFYWGPGLAVWYLLIAVGERSGWRRTLATTVVVGAVAVLVGGWKYAHNWRVFGNPFAPAVEFARVNQQGSVGRAGAAWYIAETHLWQLFQPNSNPRIFASSLAGPAGWLSNHLDHTAPNRDLAKASHDLRTGPLQRWVSEDDVTFGVVPSLLTLIGFTSALWPLLRGKRRTSDFPIALGLAVALFFGFFFTQPKIGAWDFRYFVLVAPFMAVVASSFPMRGTFALTGVLVLMVFATYSAFEIQARNDLGGWRALLHPDDVEAIADFASIQTQVIAAAPPGSVTTLALPMNDWLSPYYRLPGGRKTETRSLSEIQARFPSPQAFLLATRSAVLVTTPRLFSPAETEGVTVMRTRLSARNAQSLFFVAPPKHP